MAHIRKPLAAAALLNTAVFAIEAIAGTRAHSLSLLMDSVHNFSDELALLCLLAAYVFAVSLSRGLQRIGNLLNSLGLIALSLVFFGQAVDRLFHPQPVIGWLPATVGLFAAAGNWGVARNLRDWQQQNASIRLAYLHNLGDMYVSLAPVVAGVLVVLTGRSVFDPLAAAVVGLWLVASTAVELGRSSEELFWPADARCPHDDSAEAHPA
jgi:cation diffusion facilitator family transporter